MQTAIFLLSLLALSFYIAWKINQYFKKKIKREGYEFSRYNDGSRCSKDIRKNKTVQGARK